MFNTLLLFSCFSGPQALAEIQLWLTTCSSLALAIHPGCVEFLFPLFTVLGFFKIYSVSSNSALNATLLYKPSKHLVYFSLWGMLHPLRLWNMVSVTCLLVFWCGSIQQSQKIFPRQTSTILSWLSQASSTSCENQQWWSLPSPIKHIFTGLSKGISKYCPPYFRKKKNHCRKGPCKLGHGQPGKI